MRLAPCASQHPAGRRRARAPARLNARESRRSQQAAARGRERPLPGRLPRDPHQSTMALLLMALLGSSSAELRVSNTLGSNMVLQRGRPAPIWGWASSGASVKVAFDGVSHSATATAGGLWKVALPAQQASLVPKTIEISSGTEHVSLSNVLFGDVILCSALLCFSAAGRSAHQVSNGHFCSCSQVARVTWSLFSPLL